MDNEPNLREAFKLFDKNNSGAIDASEIATVLGGDIVKDEAVW